MASIKGWAARQLADYDAREPGMLFAEGVELSVDEGYALQSAVAELRVARGERIIGYKVGCTSSGIRAQLGIDHCITGRLFESEKHVSGATLSRKHFVNLAVEGELAVELSREPNSEDFSGEGIPACVARIIPVIELHHFVMRGERPSAGELIANNAIHAGFVAGEGVRREDVQSEPALAIYSNDRLLDECAGLSLIQTIGSSLKWLSGIVRNRGDQLSEGQIVLTGSIPGLIPVEEDGRIRVETIPFGGVEANFVE